MHNEKFYEAYKAILADDEDRARRLLREAPIDTLRKFGSHQSSFTEFAGAFEPSADQRKFKDSVDTLRRIIAEVEAEHSNT